MAIQSQPSRISQPFAGSGTKNAIPATNATPSASQAASWASGFPPECSQPISAGGCPVPRNDVNGVLNQISQDYAFRQDGGIWAWSALADYDTGRFVRGSDNNFYRAVAQNGPGTSAGTKDPTADDGTYWIKMPSMADIAAQNYASQSWVTSQGYATQTWVGNQGYATQTWVKNFAIAQVYVDPNGVDSNNGLSSSAPVQTFQKAIEIGRTLPVARINIVAVAGTYSGDIKCEYGDSVAIFQQGNITINGSIVVYGNGYLLFQDINYTTTIYGQVQADADSSIYFNSSNVSITPSSQVGLAINGNSYVFIAGNLTLLVLNADNAIAVYKNSCLVVSGTITSSVDVSGPAITVNENSILNALSGVTVNSQDSDNNHNNTRASSALHVEDSSFAYIYRLDTTNIFSGPCCLADNGSSVVLANGGYLHGPKTGTTTVTACLMAVHDSTIRVTQVGGTQTDCITHNQYSSAVFVGYCSNITIYASFLVDTYNYGTDHGSANCVVYCVNDSFFAFTGTISVWTLDSVNVNAVFKASACCSMSIDANVSFGGNASANPNCYKYVINSCSVLGLNGRNANLLPGPQAGTTATNGIVV